MLSLLALPRLAQDIDGERTGQLWTGRATVDEASKAERCRRRYLSTT
jgi:hypothetical protein